MSLRATASQTVGPFFSLGFAWLYRDAMAAPGIEDERVSIQGQVLDGAGEPVPDAMLELWQANAHGKYAHPDDPQDKPAQEGFGFGRVATDAAGRFHFTTIKPGPVPGPGGHAQAPHIVVSIFARGLLNRLVTRIYFGGDPANGEDAVLALVPPERRATLMAQPAAGEDPGQLEWNIVLQGTGETVFFAF